MRISDWSSDVCSSDLYGWSGITLMTMPCACWTAREQWARANRLVPLPMARHAIALLLSGAERDVDDSRRARIRNFGDANRVGLASAWHKQSNRSEEHTSELQSLMRISYAVFCLKKKIIANKS